MQAYARAAIEHQSVPDSLSDYELSELAHSANQEALSYGLSHDVFLRYFKTLRDKALAAAPQPQPVQEPVADIKISGDDFDLGLTDAFAFGRLRLPDGHYQLYTSPQAQPLSDDLINDLARTMVKEKKSVNWLAYAIEAAITKGTT